MLNNGGIILSNKILDLVFLSALTAQVYKCIVPIFKTGKFDFTKIFATGGMPSSHSSSTVTLATSVALVNGIHSVEFAIATLFAVVTMQDATGVRQEAGKHAKILNRVLEERRRYNAEEMHELKEFLGHTPLEVLMGAILGLIIPFLFKGYLI